MPQSSITKIELLPESAFFADPPDSLGETHAKIVSQQHLQQQRAKIRSLFYFSIFEIVSLHQTKRFKLQLQKE